MVETQSREIAASLVAAKVYLPAKPQLAGEELRDSLAKTKAVALIAYIQKLGACRPVAKEGPAMPTPLNPDSYRAMPNTPKTRPQP